MLIISNILTALEGRYCLSLVDRRKRRAWPLPGHTGGSKWYIQWQPFPLFHLVCALLTHFLRVVNKNVVLVECEQNLGVGMKTNYEGWGWVFRGTEKLLLHRNQGSFEPYRSSTFCFIHLGPRLNLRHMTWDACCTVIPCKGISMCNLDKLKGRGFRETPILNLLRAPRHHVNKELELSGSVG